VIQLKYLMQAIEKQEAKLKLPVVRMEIDYELVTLYDAMQEKDEAKIKQAKKRLFALREQLNEILDDEHEHV